MQWVNATVETLEDRRLLSVSVLSSGVVKVIGTDQNDDVVVRIDPNDAANLQVYDQSQVKTIARSDVRGIVVAGGRGDDRLFVENGNGFVSRTSGDLLIQFDGGEGADRVIAIGDAANDADLNGGYAPGKETGSGALLTRARAGKRGVFQRVVFSDVEDVLDLSPAASLTIYGTKEANVIALEDGPIVNQQPTGRLRLLDVKEHKKHGHDRGKDNSELIVRQSYASVTFANKGQLSIDAGKGKDFINVNLSRPPAGLRSLCIDGGGGRDELSAGALPSALDVSRRRIERDRQSPGYTLVTEFDDDDHPKEKKKHDKHEDKDDDKHREKQKKEKKEKEHVKFDEPHLRVS